MNEEHLALYRRLSETKIYKERFGEWSAGDKVWRKCTVFGEDLDKQIWSEDQRTEIIVIRSKSSLQSKTYWHCTASNGDERLLSDQDILSTTCLWLPPVFDPENPERCLVGMLNGDISLERISDEWIVFSGSDSRGFYMHRVSEDRLDIALIKTILKQEAKP